MMQGAVARFFAHLVLLQASVPLLSTLLTLVLAPRALLLERADPSLGVWRWASIAGLIVLVQTVVSFGLVRSIAPAVRALVAGTDAEAASLSRLDALPAKLVSSLTGISTCVALATTHPALRPIAHDLASQMTLALFFAAVGAAAALPLYVRLRSAVARVLELAPAELAREALEIEEGPSRALTRVRTRFLLAVAAPVVFIALGASLLAYAHVRAAAEEGRRSAAEAVALGALEPIAGSTAGRDQAISAAAGFGMRINVGKTAPSEETTTDVSRPPSVTVPLDDGFATVAMVPQFDFGRALEYLVVVILAAVAAGLLGARLGRLYSSDLGLARETIDRIGIQQVMSAVFSGAEARFTSTGQLLESVAELGLRFREFGAAHERATHAKESTERMRALFLATMSHDLKAPLNSILGFASLVGRSPLTAEQHQSLAIIEQRGRELLHLIQTILDAARAEAGQLEIALEQIKLGDVIMSAVLDARDLAQGSEVAINAEIQPEMPELLVDGQRMVQALVGIIGAAVRFTEQGEVMLRATHGPSVLIDVETAGRGLHPGEREQIFEAFKHVDRARRLGSLGLELSLARAIVERHQGLIDVDVPQGGGIVFHVRLPTDDAPISVPRPSVRPPRV